MKSIQILILVLFACTTRAQLFQADASLLEYQRVNELLGTDSNQQGGYSFLIRKSELYWAHKQKAIQPKNFNIQLITVGSNIQYNSHLTVGFNDGSMLPNVGIQQRWTAGFKLNWGKIHVQFQPEWVQAENKPIAPLNENTDDTYYKRNFYLYIRNKIDVAFRVGRTPIQQFYWGQSNLKIQGKHLSFGISTENLWWGPGLRNSILLSNHAPGFTHLSFNTTKPLKTKLGNVEFQMIAGNLNNLIQPLVDFESIPRLGVDYLETKSKNSRAIAGYMLSWSPSFLKNFYIGLGGVSYFYKSTPTLFPTVNVLDYEKNLSKPANLSSISFRYAIPSEQAEIYFEYGRSGKVFAPIHIIGDTIATGYQGGIRKFFLLNSGKKGKTPSAIMFSLEFTQLQLPDNRLIFSSLAPVRVPKTNSWYTHPVIRQGYTNEGQVIGASIGPGSNSQTLQVSWVKGLKRIGFSFERVLHNTDFYQFHYFNGRIGAGNPSNYWADINTGFHVQWNYKKILFSSSYLYTKALNYRWIKLDGGFAGPSKLSDRFNHQWSTSLFYVL